MPTDVHPQIKEILDATLVARVPKLHTLTHIEARELMEKLAHARRGDCSPPKVNETEDTTTDSSHGAVPMRIYRNHGTNDSPALIYYHGGGHVFGSLDTHDSVCRNLCKLIDATIISVGYRLGPEYKFPVAVNDAFHALEWVCKSAKILRIDRHRIAVAGDSAGGNLAAVVCLLARKKPDVSLGAQCLIYPIADYRGGTPSYQQYAEGYGLLEAKTMAWFRGHYLSNDSNTIDWRASPLLSPTLDGVPPALVITAQCDVLHDEGKAYADRLRNAGILVEYIQFQGMIHGFFTYLGVVDAAERAHRTVAEFLARQWS